MTPEQYRKHGAVVDPKTGGWDRKMLLTAEELQAAMDHDPLVCAMIADRVAWMMFVFGRAPIGFSIEPKLGVEVEDLRTP
jgi:hypothetical protein